MWRRIWKVPGGSVGFRKVPTRFLEILRLYEERGAHAVDERGHFDEVDRGVRGSGADARRKCGVACTLAVVHVGMRRAGTSASGPPDLRRPRIGRHSKNLKVVVHNVPLARNRPDGVLL